MFGWLKNMIGGARKPAPPPIPQGPLDEAALKQALTRYCAPVVFTKPANIDPFETMFGAVRLERKGEVWPSCNGTPMLPLCQLNLRQAPLLPKALMDLSLVTLFVAETESYAPTQIIDTQNPDQAATWALRSYTSLEGLTIPQPLRRQNPFSPRRGDWAEAQADYANHDMAGHVVDTMANDVYAYDWSRTVAQTKLGGWPGTVQSEPWWDDPSSKETWDFVLQIENEPKAGWFGWGDGAAYIARSRQKPHRWAIDVQFN
ncbi:DUF1963 domain-containing protein [Sulfitobacter donghicola]|uniref:DUF1963 domain-containing protein n=1 Tax=Sulfitobacter donghicola DSW-25 = KCTC 12864 = JCM 14565 TaxID=1300350 RepID=A0A073ILB5_9RHOB|nr:DUF1963 domain-containing protein [Sulfitobacter donghicola]KEJ90301.1 hypothetical protein DSW25_05895 [Sulfitobacter donghicola DSW-25 = KCTC 12864 = JCM 14565]KIN67144.1 hypothetical protein Z948_850 [Sulfitobacter donghicola DSW-25 = KCTC 12864 = JCM 14565]